MQTIILIGEFSRAVILHIASLLTHESAPGFIAFLLLLTLVLSSFAFWRRVNRQRRAVIWLRKQISASVDEVDFSRDIDLLGEKIEENNKSIEHRQLIHAWRQYRQTFVAHQEGKDVILRNSVRPSNFLNVEDLGFGAGAWRIASGLFVTVGLFLTFLGLISALHAMSQGDEINSATMRTLLSVASAKFIMSLTGLFCSIVFTIIFRRVYGSLLKVTHELCGDIEDKVPFISLEALAMEQLQAVREQREHFRIIGLELVAELGRPLREELPNAISSSISAAMAPMMDRVGKLGAEGVGDIVSGLSTQLTDTVGLALSEASQRLADAGMKIGQLADRLDQSSGRMGSEMEAATVRVAQAVDDLRNSMAATTQSAGWAFTQGADRLLTVMNQTLESIRSNTDAGAQAMANAAESFRAEIEAAAKSGSEAAHARLEVATQDASSSIGAAGQNVVNAFDKTGAEIARIAEQAVTKANQELMAPLGIIADQLQQMIAGLNRGNADLQRMADGVRAGAVASVEAAGNFRAASNDLISAASPIRGIAEHMNSSTRQLSDSTQHVATVVSRTAEMTAEMAATALKSAQQILGQEAKAIEASLAGLATLVEHMKGQGDRLDDMDVKLGAAFETYTEQVARAIDGMFGHVRDIQNRLNPALDTMREIVEQAEQFSPQSRRA